jgi:hypothetical protein
MKRLILALVVLAMFLPGMVNAATDTCYTTGNNTEATKQVYRGTGTFCGMSVTNNGAADCTVTCYKSATAATSEATAISTDLICPFASARTCIFSDTKVGFTGGLYCVMSGAGCKYNVYRHSGL